VIRDGTPQDHAGEKKGKGEDLSAETKSWSEGGGVVVRPSSLSIFGGEKKGKKKKKERTGGKKRRQCDLQGDPSGSFGWQSFSGGEGKEKKGGGKEKRIPPQSGKGGRDRCARTGWMASTTGILTRGGKRGRFRWKRGKKKTSFTAKKR